jgi:hypothetical protein
MKEGLLGGALGGSSKSELEKAHAHVARWIGASRAGAHSDASDSRRRHTRRYAPMLTATDPAPAVRTGSDVRDALAASRIFLAWNRPALLLIAGAIVVAASLKLTIGGVQPIAAFAVGRARRIHLVEQLPALAARQASGDVKHPRPS